MRPRIRPGDLRDPVDASRPTEPLGASDRPPGRRARRADPRAGGDRGGPGEEGCDPLLVYRSEAARIHEGIAAGYPTLVHGPTGAGKSYLVTQVVKKVFPGTIYVVSLSGETSAEDLFGSLILRNGATEFRPGILLLAMLERKPVMLEEIDGARPETLFCLNRIVGREGPIFLTMLDGGDGGIAEIDPWTPAPGETSCAFFICATANTTGTGDRTGLYRGTRGQNAAFMNRWFKVRLGYPPPDVEAKIITNRTPASEECAAKIVRFAGEARGLPRLRVPISIRSTMRWAGLESRMGFDEAFAAEILGSADEDDVVVLRETFQRIFSRMPPEA